MLICGVEIKGSEAIVCLLEFKQGVFVVPDCRVRKITYSKQNRTSDLRYFQSTFAKLMQDYGIKDVVIKERPLSGKFSGGALGFKIEAAIQLIESLTVYTYSAQTLKASLKRNPARVHLSDAGLKVFQEHAFLVAHAFHMDKAFPDRES